MSFMRRVPVLAVIVSILSITACKDDGGAKNQLPIVIQLQSDPVSLDPALAEDGHSMRILANTMEGLVAYDENGALKPKLAKSYRVSADGLQVEFILRSDARWSDGEPVRAGHFVDGLRRSLDPATGSRLRSLLFSIRGAKKFRTGKGKKYDQLGVRAEGNRVIFELERPASFFIEALTLSVALPIRPDVLKLNHERWPIEAPGTGPYRIVKHRVGQFYRLELNDHYYDSESVEGARPVKLVLIEDESTAANLFENGAVDVLTRVPSLDLKRLRGKGLIDVSPYFATYYVAFNVRRKPFNNLNWRKAVASVIRKEEIAQLLQTGESPAWSWIPRGLDGFQPFRENSQGFSEAADLVRREVAASKKHRRPKLELLFDGNSRNLMIAEKIQKDIQDGLGLRISLDSMDWKSFVRSLHIAPPAMYRFAWLAPFSDPITHLQVFTSGNPNNHTGWSNSRYDGLVEEIERLPKGAERRKKVIEAQKLLVETEVPVVPIYHYVQIHAVRKNVKAFKVNPFGVIHFERLRKSD